MTIQGKKAALFDLDGVVFDTEPQYTMFWTEQFRIYHPDRPEMVNEIKGATLERILEIGWSGPLEGERQRVADSIDAFEAQMQIDFVAGFEDYIELLHRQGVKTAVVTSSNQQKMSYVYRRHPELRPMFDAILTSEDFTESKPSADCYLRAAARFGLDSSQCVVFEDSINGLRAGRAAAMTVVGLLTTNPIETVGPLSDIQISDYTNLPDELTRWTR